MEWDNDMNIIVNFMEQEIYFFYVSIIYVKFYILQIFVCVFGKVIRGEKI